ncbi:MAG: class I SAM-dependent rRNA methyltransferase [Desulfovibrionaceae bacterium]|nr:class I SAM-dependent rRNA methyltransferase [Desulfovibrionaceae bacterium]
MQSLFLKKNEDRRLRSGHLWIFSNEIDTARSPLSSFTPGECVSVFSASGRPLGSAYINPSSLIAARMYDRTQNCMLNADLLRRRIQDALALRKFLFNRPFYRLCHGEGDFLPGLVADRYGNHVSIQLTTSGMERAKDEILSVFDDLLHPHGILIRNDIPVRILENLPLEDTDAFGVIPDEIAIEENNTLYTVPFKTGQKTGWFYDQRLNRAAVARLAKGGAMLDAFCYAGGFGTLAAKEGASSITFLDASAHALSYAERNCRENAPRTPAEFLQGDAFEQLSKLKNEGRKFKTVCLDPPAFIKRRKDMEQGINAYRKVNEIGLQLVENYGNLITCSCSQHLEASALRRMVASAAAKRGLLLQEIRQGHQGPDHPVHPSMPETEYLKVFVFRVWHA